MSKARELAALGNAYSDGALSNRNLIINGAMQVAQRTYGPVSVAPYQYNTADRMRFSFSGANAGSWTQEIVSGQDVGDYVGNAMKNTCTSAGDAGITAGNNIRLEKTDIEKFVGKTLTLSFYAKADAALTMTPQVFGDTVVDLDQLTFTTSYQRYVSTFTVPAMTTKSFFDLAMRVDASVATTHYITGVQLEVGDTATPFEHRSYGQELALCQRYFWRSPVPASSYGYYGNVAAEAATGASGAFYYPVAMRSAPTGSSSGTFQLLSNTAVTVTSVAFQNVMETQCRIFASVGGGLTAGYGYSLRNLGDTSAFIQLDAEL